MRVKDCHSDETVEQMVARIDKWLDTPVDKLFPPPDWLKPTIRQARMRINGGRHTTAEWVALCERYGNRCLRCGRKRKLTKDHVIPVLHGGTDDIDNIQPLCGPCNSVKHTQAVDYRLRFRL